jgi:hypothetical protein
MVGKTTMACLDILASASDRILRGGKTPLFPGSQSRLPAKTNAPFNHYHGEGTGSINSGKPNSYAITFDIYDWVSLVRTISGAPRSGSSMVKGTRSILRSLASVWVTLTKVTIRLTSNN